MSIGNHEEAALALAAHEDRISIIEGDSYPLGEVEREVYDGTWEGVSESWTLTMGDFGMIGCGSTRAVWSQDNEVAYKIGLDQDEDAENLREWERWESYNAKMPKGTRLPVMQMYMVNGRAIIAVEIIKFPRQYAETPKLPFDFLDNGDYNYRVCPETGTFIPIDFAY